MGTKNDPGLYDCYEKAEADEPMFILLARDDLAPTVVRMCGLLRKLDRSDDEAKIVEAMECANAMEKWYEDMLKIVGHEDG